MDKSSEAISTIYSCLLVLTREDSLKDKYLDEYVPKIPLNKLIMLKRNKDSNKNGLDILIARKIKSMEHILNYNPDILDKYLKVIEDINYIDAIIILLDCKNSIIFEIANRKYCEYYERELDNDARLNNVVDFKYGDLKRVKNKHKNY